MSEHSVDMTFEVVDQATGEVKPVFHINGQPTYVAELPGKNAERLAAYMRIRADLQDVERWLHQAYELLPKLDVNRIAKSDDTFVNSTDHGDLKLPKAYYYAAITLYGKCFTEAEGRKVKLEQVNIEKDYHPVHKRIMKHRNTIAAHAGVTDLEHARLVIVFPQDFMQATSAEPRPFFLRTPMGRLDFMDDRSMQFNTVGLVQHVATLVDNKIAELERKVVDEIRGSIPALFNTAMENSKTGG
jgi:hypothetical protein